MITQGLYGKFNYLLYEPTHLKEKNNLSLIVVLHGSGEISTSRISKLQKREPYISLNKGTCKPNAYVLMPQLPKNSWKNYTVSLKDLIDHIATQYNCNTQSISITGHSLGGGDLFEFLLKYPTYFCAAAALSPHRDYSSRLNEIAHIPIWFFHGEKERSFKKYAQAMNNKMKALDGITNITSLKGEGHPIQHVWTDAKYGLFDWLSSFNSDFIYPTWNEWLGLKGYKINEPIAQEEAQKLGIQMIRKGK